MWTGRCGRRRCLRACATASCVPCAPKTSTSRAGIDIRHGWDQYEGEIDPKSERGRRSTVIVAALRDLLASHLALTGRSGNDLILGRSPTRPFATNTINARARHAWAAARRCEDEEGTIPVSERIRPI